MPIFYGYQNAIFGTQSTMDGSPHNYNVAPTEGSTWSWTGTTTNFAVQENDGATTFNGDLINEQVDADEQIGGTWEQTVDIGGNQQQIIWDYTFTVTASDGTVYRVAVIDVDLNNDDDLNDASEDGYYLIFPDGVPPEGEDYTIGPVVENDGGTSHIGLGAEIVCFAAGTLIQTADGANPIDELRVGDLIQTRDEGLLPLRWIGKTSVAALGNLAPIVVTQGTLGNDRELVVSPQHGIVIDDWRAEVLFGEQSVIARAVDLENGDTIYRRPGGSVTYFHMMFDRHQIVFAEGVPCESLYPGAMTMQTLSPEAREEINTLFPEIAEKPDSYGAKVARYLKSFEAVLAGQHRKLN